MGNEDYNDPAASGPPPIPTGVVSQPPAEDAELERTVEESDPEVDYSEFDDDELRAEAKGRGLEFHPNLGREKLIALLQEDDEQESSGE